MSKDEAHPYVRLVGTDANGALHDHSITVPRPSYLHCNTEEASYVELDGGQRLFYKVFGKGPRKIMMVMGLAAVHLQWEPQFTKFGIDRGEDFSVCVLDNRGIGFSGTPPGRWRTTDLAQDVWRIAEELGWTKVHLVGLSMGGMVCLEASLSRPDLLASLTLISTAASFVMPPTHGFRTLLGCFASMGTPGAINAGIDVMFPVGFSEGPPSKPPSELGEPGSRRYELARCLLLRARCYVEAGCFPDVRLFGVVKQFWAALTHYISWARLNHLRATGIPVLVCSGKLDNLILWQNSSLLADALGGRHLHFEDGGHCVNEQHPEAVNAAMLEVMDLGDRLPPRTAKPLGPNWHPALVIMIAVQLLVLVAVTSQWQEPLGESASSWLPSLGKSASAWMAFLSLVVAWQHFR